MPFDSSMAHPDCAPARIQLTQSSANATTRKRTTVPHAGLTGPSVSTAAIIPHQGHTGGARRASCPRNRRSGQGRGRARLSQHTECATGRQFPAQHHAIPRDRLRRRAPSAPAAGPQSHVRRRFHRLSRERFGASPRAGASRARRTRLARHGYHESPRW